MTTDILDPSALIQLLPTLLPASSRSLLSQQDALAALVHSALTTLAFRLIAVEEFVTAASSINNVLPLEWNRNGPGHYTFKYKHDQSSLEFLVKLSKLGTRTVINAIALESDKVATFDIPTDDFTSPSFFPHIMNDSDGQPLIHGFIASNRVSDFLSQFKLKIIQKLVPGLQKEGYIEESESSTTSASSSARPREQPPRPESPPYMPDRDPYASTGIPRNPLEIGRRDLDPFPAHPFAPPSLFPPGSGDGMFVGPDHPIFGVGRTGGPPNMGPWGGDGYLPPFGAPPGARFDPVGPTFPNRPRPRGGRGPGGGNVQGPDNDEFMPPGMGDMFM